MTFSQFYWKLFLLVSVFGVVCRELVRLLNVLSIFEEVFISPEGGFQI